MSQTLQHLGLLQRDWADYADDQDSPRGTAAGTVGPASLRQIMSDGVCSKCPVCVCKVVRVCVSIGVEWCGVVWCVCVW